MILKIKAIFRRKSESRTSIKYYQNHILVEQEKLRKLDKELLNILNKEEINEKYRTKVYKKNNFRL